MDLQNYIDNYLDWLRTRFTFQKSGEYYEISAPFLDTSNDYIQFYVKQDGHSIYFNDDGYTLHHLESHGLMLTGLKRKKIQTILNQFGVLLSGDELTMQAPVQEFPQRKHMFMQAMLRVDDLYTNVKSRRTSLFTDDIVSFFKEHDIFYTQSIQMVGKSGFTHEYDFLLQMNKTHPTRFCVAMNNPNKSNMASILFSWEDTRQVRIDNSKLIVLMNDENHIQNGIETGLENYGACPIKWSDKSSASTIALLAS